MCSCTCSSSIRGSSATTSGELDIALREIGEGKLIAEVDFDAVAKHEADQTKWS